MLIYQNVKLYYQDNVIKSIILILLTMYVWNVNKILIIVFIVSIPHIVWHANNSILLILLIINNKLFVEHVQFIIVNNVKQ
jgi:hypothetical protein